MPENDVALEIPYYLAPEWYWLMSVLLWDMVLEVVYFPGSHTETLALSALTR